MSKTVWACGFCNIGNHDACTGAVLNRGAILVCSCATHPARERCLECGNTRAEELSNWACANPSDCADAIAARSAANPLRKELETVRLMGGEARRRALAERLQRDIRAAVAESGIDAQIGYDVAADLNRPRPPRKPRTARPTSGVCICGCEGKTKGGRFQPGHDARLKSQLRQAAGNGDTGATRRMIELGWEKFLPKSVLVS